MDTNKNLPFSTQQERLHSFSSNPLPMGHENSCMKLAQAGFERQPQSSSFDVPSDEVYCRMCGLKYSGWSGESPWAVHRTLSPKCSFLNTPPSKVYRGFSSSILGSSNTHVKEDKMDSNKGSLFDLRRQLFPMYDNLALKFEGLPEIQHPFVPKRGNFLMLFESHRLLTFENPLSSEAAIYAKAGFVYDRELSCAVCVFCNCELNFAPKESIFLEICHEDKCPSCPFIRSYDVGNISREDEYLIREKVRNTFLDAHLRREEKGISYQVKHPEYSKISSRLGTFKSWPALQASEFPLELMAECGFYYTHFMDSVRCFSCGVGLRNWSGSADAFVQHAKASQHCWHVLQVKGQEFVNAAQSEELTIDVDYRESQDSDPEQDRAAITSTSIEPPSSSLSSTLPSSVSVGSPQLDLESIKAAMACGRYPNEELLLGTLRAADVNYKAVCEQQEEIIKKDSKLVETETQLKAHKSVIEATKNELVRTQHALQSQNTELRTELEHRFVEQNRVLQHKDEMLHHKDEVIHQQGEVIQNNVIQLELKNREVEDLQRQLKSIRAALMAKENEDNKDDSVTVDETAEASLTSSTIEDEFPVANCKVCLINTSQIVFYPCKHLCCCDACATRLIGRSCPICREPNLTMEKVYVI